MASKTGIANTALRRLGISQRITNIETDTSTEATSINAVYDEALDDVLGEHDWPFAQAYQLLARVEEEPNPDWAFSYRAPADMIKARRIVEPLQADLQTLNLPGLKLAPLNAQAFKELIIPFSSGNDVVDSTGGRVIFTDHDQPTLHYTSRFTDEGFFDAYFATAFSWRLAMETATALSAIADMQDRMEAKYNSAIDRAKQRAANEEQPKPDPEPGSVRARR